MTTLNIVSCVLQIILECKIYLRRLAKIQNAPKSILKKWVAWNAIKIFLVALECWKYCFCNFHHQDTTRCCPLQFLLWTRCFKRKINRKRALTRFEPGTSGDAMLTHTINTTLQDSNGKFLVKTLESYFMKTGSNTINSLQSCLFH